MEENERVPTPEEHRKLMAALEAATRSLFTIAQNAGHIESMQSIGQVRGYAHSRYWVARSALEEAGGVFHDSP